ncbi:uncharacterized protein [Rutidosis leptorrhynchoides]|uniref:uncharacterized protein n=1 Tax=Rutidosis leptorrhynchoides TaxID=125765 RepID=UPI003A99B104
MGVELVSHKKLILKSVRVDDTTLQKLLSHAPNLETLSICYSYSLRHIRVGGRALKLKQFEIRNYEHKVRSIHLSDFDLESFTYVGPRIDLSFSRLRKLNKLNLGEVYLWLGDGKQCLCPNQFCEIPNVKQLRLAFSCLKRDCLLDLAHTLNAFPSFESFKLEIHCNSSFVRKPTRNDTNPHQNLKFVEIVGYQGRNCDFELVAYIIEIAVVLKKMVVIQTLQDCTEEITARLYSKRVAKRLESILAQGVELVVV